MEILLKHTDNWVYPQDRPAYRGCVWIIIDQRNMSGRTRQLESGIESPLAGIFTHQSAENQLCRFGKFPVKHPADIVKFLRDRLSLALAKIEDHFTDLVHAEIPGEINNGVWIAEFVHLVDRRTNVIVPLDLIFEDFECGPNIGFGIVSFDMRLVAVELIRGGEGSLLFLVEDRLYIDELAVGLRKQDTAPGKFLDKQRQVEPVGIEAGDVAPGKESEKRSGNAPECRLTGDVSIRNPVNGVCIGRDWELRVNEPREDFFGTIWVEFEGGDLDNPIVNNVRAGGLKIKEDERACKLQFHLRSRIIR
jgi:hypothetical protein